MCFCRRLEAEDEAEEDINDDLDEDSKDKEITEDNVKVKDDKDSQIAAALDAAVAIKVSSEKKKKKKKDGDKRKEIEEQVEEDLKYINDIDAKYRMDNYNEEDESSSKWLLNHFVYSV